MAKRNKDYLAFIRSLPCLSTGSTHEVVAHHVRIGQDGGMGMKPSDYRCIPLTSYEHMILHSTGERSYYQQKQIDHEQEIVANLLVYAARKLSEDRSDLKAAIEHLESLLEDIK